MSYANQGAIASSSSSINSPYSGTVGGRTAIKPQSVNVKKMNQNIDREYKQDLQHLETNYKDNKKLLHEMYSNAEDESIKDLDNQFESLLGDIEQWREENFASDLEKYNQEYDESYDKALAGIAQYKDNSRYANSYNSTVQNLQKQVADLKSQLVTDLTKAYDESVQNAKTDLTSQLQTAKQDVKNQYSENLRNSLSDLKNNYESNVNAWNSQYKNLIGNLNTFYKTNYRGEYENFSLFGRKITAHKRFKIKRVKVVLRRIHLRKPRIILRQPKIRVRTSKQNRNYYKYLENSVRRMF